jgi:L-rhamnose-H+ transport protein
MTINSNIVVLILAGLMNGSFVIPANYMKNISYEKKWFLHSLIGCAVIPWTIFFLTMSNTIPNYWLLNSRMWTLLIISGFFFGIGQVCFAYAIEIIGIALSFTINIGTGLTIGSLFVILYEEALFTSQGYLVIFAVLLILIGLIINYLSGRKSLRSSYGYQNKYYHLGWILALVTGITSGLQNISFIILAFQNTLNLQSSNSFWVWPPFLLAAALPMLVGFGYQLYKKNKSIFFDFHYVRNILLVSIMGFFFTGSLAFYSKGMSQMNRQQQIIGWPTFMVSIILVSQIWGWFYHESMNDRKTSRYYQISSVILLMVAIFLLAKA